MISKIFILNASKCLIGIIGLISAFYSIINLTIFLSDPNKHSSIDHFKRDEWLTNCFWTLLLDMVLLTLFIGQHSVLASTTVKLFFEKHGILDIYRSFYIITSSLVLQILFSFWLPVEEITLWKLNLNYKPLWFSYYAIHLLSWIFIYVGNICMDINELLGIKQVIHSIRNVPENCAQKSQELRKLCSHINHPSFTAFMLLFWISPVMSLDRLVLAIVLSIYLCIGCKTEQGDYDYHKNQYDLKCHELSYLES